LVFLRGGWADDGGSLYQASISTGFGYQIEPGRDLLGVGLNWSKPNSGTFGPGLGDQFTMEVFQRWDITEGLQITPSVQLIANPALNPESDFTALFGLRTRIIF
jgi:porin